MYWSPGLRRLWLTTYLGFACDFDEHVEQTLLGGGLAEALDGDADLVRHVAAVSLGASLELSSERLARLSDMPLDLGAAISRVREIWPVEKYPLAATGAGGFLMSAV